LFVPHTAYWQVANISAFAYQQLAARSVRRVIVLGACHEGIPSTLDSCFLPSASLISLDTPLGSLLLDSDTMKRLRAMDHFRLLDAEADSIESAVEAQLPWIAHMLHGQECMVVPILLGQLSAKTEDALAANISEFLSDPHSVVIVSSDWTQFGDDYMYVRPAGTSQQQAKRQRELQERVGKSDKFAPLSDDINDAIARADLSMVQAIEACDNQSFCQSINSSGVSICGRHAISTVLKAINRQSNKFQIRFQRYAQQRLCHSTADACISFFSGGTQICGSPFLSSVYVLFQINILFQLRASGLVSRRHLQATALLITLAKLSQNKAPALVCLYQCCSCC
jgi:AmmeMemoRadiSam system protein B